jgi:hypothetical protein
MPREVHGIEGKDRRLWSVSLFMTLALTAGLLAFLLPKIMWNLEILRLEGLYVRQLLFGLDVLVLLYGIQTLDLRRKVSQTRKGWPAIWFAPRPPNLFRSLIR